MTVVAVVAVVWPVLRQPPVDSFPLSTYPMFSSPIEPVADLEVAVGVDAAGADVRLSPELIAATDEVILAGALVRRSVRTGSPRPADLCGRIAARASGTDAVRIEVRTDRVDAIAWFDGRRSPARRTVHATCEVPR